MKDMVYKSDVMDIIFTHRAKGDITQETCADMAQDIDDLPAVRNDYTDGYSDAWTKQINMQRVICDECSMCMEMVMDRYKKGEGDEGIR
jgi:hypothetical protein